MAKIEIYDPPLCCSTGVCGPKVDENLVRFAADADWLEKSGVLVERFNLAQQPAAFMGNEKVRERLMIEGNGCLPLLVVDGDIVVSGRYPNRTELAALTQVRIDAEAEAGDQAIAQPDCESASADAADPEGGCC